jgi:hypothetical protein
MQDSPSRVMRATPPRRAGCESLDFDVGRGFDWSCGELISWNAPQQARVRCCCAGD